MGTLNYLRKAAEEAVSKAGAFAVEHKDTATGALDKAASFVNERTDGKYADKVAKATSAAQSGVAKATGASAPQGTATDPGTRMTGGVSSDGTPMTGPR